MQPKCMLQETHVGELKLLLKQRDEAQKEVTNNRLSQIYINYLKQLETNRHKIHKDYIKCKSATASALTS